MLSPNIIGFMLFFAGPLLLSFYLSFTDNSVGQVPNFIGLSNYAKLMSIEFQTTDNPDIFAQDTLSFGYAVLGEFDFGNTRLIIGAKDRFFWVSLRNTIYFCLLLLPLAVIPAVGMALILNSSLPGVKFFRALYFLPSVAAVVGTALIWRWLYSPVTGYINYAIATVYGWFGQADPEIGWLSDPQWVLLSIIILAAWQVVGYNTVLILAGLQGIPKTLYEASQIDGANRWNQFWNVTIPMLQPTLFFVLITTMVTGLQVFNEPYALFPARPIPENATTSVYYLYTQGFNQFQFGYASSVAWILFAIIFALTLLQFRFSRSEAYD
jgi:ABC-type sugar transport system permease subunit